MGVSMGVKIGLSMRRGVSVAVSMPRVTVLMAVHDTPAELLDQAIHSIRSQTFDALEFLILDDGSRQESTRAALREHAAADPRIRILWEPHRGLTRTLNRGLATARGEWIARQDADDWSDGTRLERQLEFLASHPECGLCGTAAWAHRHDGKPLWQVPMPASHTEIRAAFSGRNPFVHGSTMFRAKTSRAFCVCIQRHPSRGGSWRDGRCFPLFHSHGKRVSSERGQRTNGLHGPERCRRCPAFAHTVRDSRRVPGQFHDFRAPAGRKPAQAGH